MTDHEHEKRMVFPPEKRQMTSNEKRLAWRQYAAEALYQGVASSGRETDFASGVTKTAAAVADQMLAEEIARFG